MRFWDLIWIVVFACVAGLYGTGLMAQDDSVSVRMRLAFAQEEHNQVYFYSDNSWQDVAIAGTRISPEISYTGGRVLSFYRQQPMADMALPEAVATVTFPEGVAKEVILLFIPRRGQPAYDVRVLEPERFEEFTVFFVNLTQRDVAGSFGGPVQQVQAGESRMVSAQRNEVNTMRMQLAIRERSNGDWRLASTTALPARPGSRWMAVWLEGQNAPLLFFDRIPTRSRTEQSVE